MKVRLGFVSNSSSSSFICDISGETVEGMDISLKDAEMYECEHGHVFCEEYILDFDENFANCDDEYEFRYNVREKYCPICSFKYIMENDCVRYIQKQYNMTQSEVFDYMKSKNSRLRKVRNIYWFELCEIKFGVSKLALIENIKSKYSSLEDFYKNI